jgi:hypothetical protein
MTDIRTAICIASGPSLTIEDVEYCRGKGIVYVVNDCHRLAPWADILYACDFSWWDYHKGVPEFQGKKYSMDKKAHEKYGIGFVRSNIAGNFSVTPDIICLGSNSGFQAMNLAYIHGHKRIILLGYDMKLAEDGKKHWFGAHPEHLNRGSNYKRWLQKFEKAVPILNRYGIEVINCTKDSALECFKKSDLREVL